ncbi:MAG: nucleoside triphosphate pyrophosphohydrolase [Nitrospirae bacterium RBG_19FT_COMBO_42_15]|nr:MAG: nucleoside triphosphate pyrophosphohydrolase [Nitrospirae bacterium RBG_19FT_COMBO_42_15]
MSKRFNNLLKIMSKLRGKKGCPWDKEQTRESLKPFIIEEAYEVIEAIDEKSPEKLKEELGDLLLQVVFHAQLAKEKKEFDMEDILTTLEEKLIRRHPHVFGDVSYEDAKEVLVQWEKIKKEEKANIERESMLDSVPKELPALLRAHRLQDKASRVGFDWKHIDDVFAKVEEEIKEFKGAVKDKKADEIEDELGDIFFALVNVARFLEINPEDALRKTISKFISRFRYIEEKAKEAKRELSDMTLEEMDKYWDEAKGRHD